MSELSAVARQIAEQAKTLAAKADAAGMPPSRMQIEAMKGAINRLQSGLNRIQAETDAWADEPLERVSRRPRRPSFNLPDRDRLIKALREARYSAVKCSAAEPFGSPRYKFCHAVMTSVDDLAADLTETRRLAGTPNSARSFASTGGVA